MVLIPTSITLMIFSWGIGLASDPFKVQEVFVDADVLGSQDKMNALQSLMVVIGTRAVSVVFRLGHGLCKWVCVGGSDGGEGGARGGE